MSMTDPIADMQGRPKCELLPLGGMARRAKGVQQ